MLREHIAYVGALTAAGVSVEVLPPLEGFPDSVFVEDPALVFTAGAILLRSGAATRAGEVAEIAPVLHRRFERVLRLSSGHADGGDVLVTPNEVLIGLSARTDVPGADALCEALAELGLTGRIVEPPAGVLHLKTGATLIDDETVLCNTAMADSGLFHKYRVLRTGDGEEAAANSLRVNDVILAGAGYPRTLDRLTARGLEVVPLAVAEVACIDAGLSCMSLRWKAAVA